MKIAQKTYRRKREIKKKVNLLTDLQKQLTSQKILLDLSLVTTVSWIKASKEVFISKRESIRSVANIGTDPDEKKLRRIDKHIAYGEIILGVLPIKLDWGK